MYNDFNYFEFCRSSYRAWIQVCTIAGTRRCFEALRHSFGFTHDNGFCVVAVNSGSLFLQPLSWYVSPPDLLVLEVDDSDFR